MEFISKILEIFGRDRHQFPVLVFDFSTSKKQKSENVKESKFQCFKIAYFQMFKIKKLKIKKNDVHRPSKKIRISDSQI